MFCFALYNLLKMLIMTKWAHKNLKINMDKFIQNFIQNESNL